MMERLKILDAFLHLKELFLNRFIRSGQGGGFLGMEPEGNENGGDKDGYGFAEVHKFA